MDKKPTVDETREFNLSGLNGTSDETVEIISRRKKLVNEPG